MILPLAAVPFVMKIVMALWLISCLALVFIIMIQKGKGGGLSAAFGGAGGTSSLFGAKTGDFLTWVTIGVAGVFLFLAVIMGLYYRPTVSVPQQAVTAPGTSQPQPAAPGAQPQVPVQPQTPATQPAAPAPAQSGSTAK
jgi:preprotein translocase subunit SecG